MKTTHPSLALGLLLGAFLSTPNQAATAEDAALVKSRALEAVIWGMPAVKATDPGRARSIRPID